MLLEGNAIFPASAGDSKDSTLEKDLVGADVKWSVVCLFLCLLFSPTTGCLKSMEVFLKAVARLVPNFPSCTELIIVLRLFPKLISRCCEWL